MLSMSYMLHFINIIVFAVSLIAIILSIEQFIVEGANVIANDAVKWNFYGVTHQEFTSILPGGFFNVTLTVNEAKLAKADINMPALEILNSTALKEDGWNVDAGKLQVISYDSKKKIRVYGTSVGFNAPEIIGVHYFQWGNGKLMSDRIALEVTCSDGIICNGEEKLVYVEDPMTKVVSMKCMSPLKPLCDDENDCTIDTCDEATGRCTFTRDPTVPEKKCPKCFGDKCVPKCAKRECGADGCGGTCGPDCTGEGEFCVAGKCKVASLPGMCNNPYNITEELGSKGFKGRFEYFGDTREGVDVIRPFCNPPSAAGEIIYMIKMPSNARPTGIDARSISASGDPSKLDTVLQLIEVNPVDYPNPHDGCFAAAKKNLLVATCVDDSYPPGGWGSRITWVLKPGFFYFLQVDGFSLKDVGKFKLSITLTPDCSMRCEGKVCGDSSCGLDFTCGTCKEGYQCSTDGARCYKAPCKPNCKGRSCGDDGCGGTCGSCDESQGYLCSPPTGKCLKVGRCDNFKPKCSHKVKVGKKFETHEGCANNQYCGFDCNCYDLDADFMDLFVDSSQMNLMRIAENYLVEPNSCAYQEGCLDSPGLKRVLRFPTNVGNQGRSHFSPAHPPESRPDLYVWGQCHGHWHFDGFADFTLMSKDLQTVVSAGRKRSYCAEDSYQFIQYPSAPCLPKTNCNRQGLSRGWIDVYSQELDCQFVDVTKVPKGEYVLKQCTNIHRTYEEATRLNNCLFYPVKIN